MLVRRGLLSFHSIPIQAVSLNSWKMKYSTEISDNEYTTVVHSTLEILSDKLLELEDHIDIPGFDVEYTVSFIYITIYFVK